MQGRLCDARRYPESGAAWLDGGADVPARPNWTASASGGVGGCDGTSGLEHLEGEDSLLFLAQDLETPPEPGKPFDAAVYQQVAVTPGTAYSLSGWMVSLCGGSATPSSCPADYYMEKLLGIDPTGGTDPLGPNVIWVGDRRNFTETRWAQSPARSHGPDRSAHRLRPDPQPLPVARQSRVCGRLQPGASPDGILRGFPGPDF